MTSGMYTWEIPMTADSAIDGHPGGVAPPRGIYKTAGPDISGVIALLCSLFLCTWMQSDSFLKLTAHSVALTGGLN